MTTAERGGGGVNDRMRAALEQAIEWQIPGTSRLEWWVDNIVTVAGKGYPTGTIWRALEIATEERTCGTCSRFKTFRGDDSHGRCDMLKRIEPTGFGCIHHTPKQSPTEDEEASG